MNANETHLTLPNDDPATTKPRL